MNQPVQNFLALVVCASTFKARCLVTSVKTTASLFDAVGCFRELANIIGTLWDKRFLDLSDAEVFNDLDSALFQDHGQSLEKMKADWNTLGKYVFLTNSGEQFDDSKTFIICRPEGFVRVLYKLRDDKFGSLSCGVMSFRTAAKAFVAWFDEQVQTTVVNTP